MEIIPINESKLKIMLTPDDMVVYRISEEMLTFEKKDVRSTFSEILDDVKAKTGFDSTSGRLFIQVYPSKDGGCEVYLTRSFDEPNRRPNKDKDRDKDKIRALKTQREYCVYSFASLDDVLTACFVLKKSGYAFDSKLYIQKECRDSYFLVLQEEVIQDARYKKKRYPNKSDLAAEYGKKMGNKEAMLYISEHASAIIDKDAVKLAGGL